MTPLSSPLTAATRQQVQSQPLQTQTAGTNGALDDAAEFESVFLATMLNQMFAGIKTDGPFGGGQGEEQFRGFLVEEYAKSITASGGIGLADAVRRELIAIQEEHTQ